MCNNDGTKKREKNIKEKEKKRFCNARADKTVPQGPAVPSESAKIREIRRHGRPDLPERGVGVAQPEAALLRQINLRKSIIVIYHR